MGSWSRRDFDPLDWEILARAIVDAGGKVADNTVHLDFESDDELEAVLRQELIEIISLFGVQDADALCERLLTDLSDRSEP
jgi:hypothetical protein